MKIQHNVPTETWENATNWATVAYQNICFSDGHVPLKELKEFVHDAEVELNGMVDLNAVDWVWTRLAETGPHGKEYRDDWEPEYRMTVYGESIETQP